MAIPRKAEARPSFWQTLRNLKGTQIAGLACFFIGASIGIQYLFSDGRKHRKRIQ
jgi:hypothetical protein